MDVEKKNCTVKIIPWVHNYGRQRHHDAMDYLKTLKPGTVVGLETTHEGLREYEEQLINLRSPHCKPNHKDLEGTGKRMAWLHAIDTLRQHDCEIVPIEDPYAEAAAQNICLLNELIRIEEEQSSRFREERMARNIYCHQKVHGRRVEFVLVGLSHAANISLALDTLEMAHKTLTVFFADSQCVEDALEHRRNHRQNPRILPKPGVQASIDGPQVSGDCEQWTKAFISEVVALK